MGDFLCAEQLGVVARGDALFRHAVHAAEIALIRHGYAQVVDAAAKAVVKCAGHARLSGPCGKYRGILVFMVPHGGAQGAGLLRSRSAAEEVLNGTPALLH